MCTVQSLQLCMQHMIDHHMDSGHILVNVAIVVDFHNKCLKPTEFQSSVENNSKQLS